MHDGAQARVLTWLATAGIGSSILILIALSLLRDSWQHPPIVLPAWGPPWDLPPAHVSLGTASLALWIAVAVGTGTVRTAHGILPNPSPAVTALLTGVPTWGRDMNVELTTPTGAAILASTATSFGPMPPMRIEATGFVRDPGPSSGGTYPCFQAW